MSLLSRDLKIHLSPENLLGTILEPRRRLSETLFLPTTQRRWEFHSGSPRPRPATSTTSVAELDHTGPSPSYPSVSVRTVSWVFVAVPTTDVWQKSFSDPTLRYLVSFLLRNLVRCNKKCSPRPFKVFGHRFRLSKTEDCCRQTLCFVNRFSWFVKRCPITLIGD